MRRKVKQVCGLVLSFAIMLTSFVMGGTEVYAAEYPASAKYYIWNDKVTLEDDGTAVVSTGPVQVSRNGSVTTISLIGNVKGTLWFKESGTYILEANGGSIFPDGYYNAIDGNFGEGLDIDLTVKGDGKYFSGDQRAIYLPTAGSTVTIESGLFYSGSMCSIYAGSIGDSVSISRKVENENVYMVTYANKNNVDEYTITPEESFPDLNLYNDFLVTQEDISDTKIGYITNRLNAATLIYMNTPTPDAVQPDNGGQGGTQPPSGGTQPPSGGTQPPSGGTQQPENNNNQSISESKGNYTHTHNFQWIVTTQPTEKTDGCNSLMCEGCGDIEATQPISYFNNITNNVMKEIKETPEKGTVTIDDEFLRCFSNEMVEELLARPDLTVVVNFTDKGINYSFTIPAGKAPTDGQEWYGYYYLGSVYGWTLMENVM